MKNIGLTALFLLACVAAFSLAQGGGLQDQRAIYSAWHVGGQMKLQASNIGCVLDLHYPRRGGADLLFVSAPWISAKKPRRDELGRQLYWLSYPPTADNAAVVAAGQPGWNPGLVAVLDTLTTIGFDGDLDLYELLPAYNPLVAGNTEVEDLYLQYNAQDLILKSILGQPSPREFVFPDPLGTYCFTIPQAGPFATPGFETLSAYYYDLCPFGTVGDRDFGQGRSQNTHYPLGLAIHQASYAWSPLPLADFVVTKYTMYNTSSVDTLFDLALANFVDPDMGPAGMSDIAADDISGYVKGPGYEFAYSYDADGDGGLAPWYLGHKLLLPGSSGNRYCWYWHLGDGPNDHHPLNLYPDFAPRLTANEKYWLQTGRNPDDTEYVPLRPVESTIPEYEQPAPNDTRYLNSLCGNIPTATDPDPDGRWPLAPGANLSWYSIHFAAPDLNALKQLSAFIEAFIASGYDLDSYASQPCVPYLSYGPGLDPGTLDLAWHSYSDPDHFLLKHRVSSTDIWTQIELPGTARAYNLGGLQNDTWYELQIFSVYAPGPGEVILPSEIVLATLNPTPADDPGLAPAAISVSCQPNPFSGNGLIRVGAIKAGPAELSVYNLKGQKVKILHSGILPAGTTELSWDGSDERGNSCPNGIYLLRWNTAGKSAGAKKITLLK